MFIFIKQKKKIVKLINFCRIIVYIVGYNILNLFNNGSNSKKMKVKFFSLTFLIDLICCNVFLKYIKLVIFSLQIVQHLCAGASEIVLEDLQIVLSRQNTLKPIFAQFLGYKYTTYHERRNALQLQFHKFQISLKSKDFNLLKQYLKQIVLFGFEEKGLENNYTLKSLLSPKEFKNLRIRTKESLHDGSTDFEKEFSFLSQLMNWYKSDYFRWMNSPLCDECNSSSTFQGYISDINDTKNIDRIEKYSCNTCERSLTFPRYNNPRILFQTRTGRCGEWVNCFYVLCRSLDYDIRYVFDKTDHVWIEVYSDVLRKWIHCDPCENKINTPLMYEKGWNKSLSYVIAFSSYEVQDVTWRYTTKYSEIIQRRTLSSEENLIRYMLILSKKLQTVLPLSRRSDIQLRRVEECAQFLTPSKTDEEYDGRISGSVQWRQSRNEYKPKSNKYIWTPNEIEIQRKRLSLKYSTSADTYQREETGELIKGWQNGVFQCESIFKKIENDWNMCYLCRTEDAKEGIIQWKFCSEKQKLHIDMVTIKYQCSTFQIKFTCTVIKILTYYSYDVFVNNFLIMLLKFLAENVMVVDAFKGSFELTLTITVSGGNGDNAWQHAQLFRQPINDAQFPFEIVITYFS
ncbi:hypothetical protein PGB90_008246 [Kerria lacca]